LKIENYQLFDLNNAINLEYNTNVKSTAIIYVWMLIYTSLIIIFKAKVSINFLRPHSASLLLLSIYNRAAHSKISDNIVAGSSRKYRKILYIVGTLF